jgi:hypothetical protein
MNEKRGFWFLLSGLVLGLSTGLLVAWVIFPIQYVDTSPSSLRIDFKDEYRFMIASAFAASADLPRAQARLATLAEPDPIKILGDQAQRMLASNSSMEQVQIIADLSLALQSHAALPNPTNEPVMTATNLPINQSTATPFDLSIASPVASYTPIFTPTPEPSTLPTMEDTPSPVPLPIFTIAPRPVRTSTPTPVAAFEISKQNTFCDPAQPGLLQIFLTNSAGKPAVGIELVITWLGGEEHFFTGFKPDINPGYADYAMTGNIEYALTLASSGTRVTGLTAPACTDTNGNAYPGGLRLEFKQP